MYLAVLLAPFKWVLSTTDRAVVPDRLVPAYTDARYQLIELRRYQIGPASNCPCYCYVFM